jgi:oligopeptide/dipeptide ABC transporter ATP-binding protein
MTDPEPIVRTEGVKKHFPVETGLLERVFTRDREWVKAVDGVDLEIYPREIFGLVGESGSGKSTLGELIVRLLDPTDGKIWFDGERIDTKSDEEMRELRKDIQIIFQDPASSLNPRRRVRDIIRRPLEVHDLYESTARRNERVEELIQEVQLKKEHLDRFPHELSGGQQQRVAIARALSVEPKMVVADEAVSALDVNVQAQILDLLEEIKREYELTILFIAHDLSLVRHISDRVGVMYLGELMEVGTEEEIYDQYQHPYTNALLQSVPKISTGGRAMSATLKGEVPSPIDPPSGCKFRTRCPLASEECAEAFDSRAFSATHTVNCVKRSPEEHGGSRTDVPEFTATSPPSAEPGAAGDPGPGE